MTDTFNKHITSYITNESRNKIVIHKEDIHDITQLNVGCKLALELKNISINRHFALKAKSKLHELLTNSIEYHSKYGSILSIYNLGILFEPELKIDFLVLIDNYSKDHSLFIKWDGEIEDNKLFFLTKKNGIEIDISNLSHIKI